MTINLVNILVGCLVFGVVGYCANWALASMTAPQPVRMVVTVLLVVLFVVWLLSELGVGGPVVHIG